MPPYRILAIDGGGVRGIIPAVILRRLAAEPAISGWLDRVHLIAGTSSGGITALALAAGLTPQAIVTFFAARSPEIFADTVLDDVRDLGRLIGAEYSTEGLERVLFDTFGELRLHQLERHVLIPAFDLDNEAFGTARTWKPKLFHNIPGSDSDGEQQVAHIARYTALAPTFFPSEDGFIDGGVYATNPAMCAVAQALDPRRATKPPALRDIALLSLGTGQLGRFIAGDRHNWGTAQWVQPLVELMLESTIGVPDFQCRQLLGARYRRVQTQLPAGDPIPLDDVRRIDDLREIAEQYDLRETIAWIANGWRSVIG